MTRASRNSLATLFLLLMSASAVAKLADYLRTDPFIRQVESQETISQPKAALWVKFRMMAAP
jgi:hypothetical protein